MTIRSLILSLGALLTAAGTAAAHCEIPCGIYGDQMRVDMLREHLQTIEKSMAQVAALQSEGDTNYNQLVRWIANKDQHASEVQEIVTQYFMTQRVKPAQASDAAARAKYVEEVTLLHQMLVSAMKCKQTTEPEHVANLRSLLDAFAKSYFEGAEHTH